MMDSGCDLIREVYNKKCLRDFPTQKGVTPDVVNPKHNKLRNCFKKVKERANRPLRLS
jgi:hypothetical protein